VGRERQGGRIRRAAAPIGALLASLLAAPAVGEEGSPPTVPLDKLLEIPDSYTVHSGVVRRGGSTRSEWQERFAKAREERDRSKVVLEELRGELEGLSTGEAWKMSPPGLGGAGAQAPSESSLDYKLSQQLRRQRQEVERTERRIKDLEIEANLAGVPEDWRRIDDVSAERPGGS
jgi:hypothetical protein